MGQYWTKWDNMGHDSGQIKLKSELRGRAFAQRVFSWSSSSFDISILLLLHLRKILKLHSETFFEGGLVIVLVSWLVLGFDDY